MKLKIFSILVLAALTVSCRRQISIEDENTKYSVGTVNLVSVSDVQRIEVASVQPQSANSFVPTQIGSLVLLTGRSHSNEFRSELNTTVSFPARDSMDCESLAMKAKNSNSGLSIEGLIQAEPAIGVPEENPSTGLIVRSRHVSFSKVFDCRLVPRHSQKVILEFSSIKEIAVTLPVMYACDPAYITNSEGTVQFMPCPTPVPPMQQVVITGIPNTSTPIPGTPPILGMMMPTYLLQRAIFELDGRDSAAREFHSKCLDTARLAKEKGLGLHIEGEVEMSPSTEEPLPLPASGTATGTSGTAPAIGSTGAPTGHIDANENTLPKEIQPCPMLAETSGMTTKCPPIGPTFLDYHLKNVTSCKLISP